MADEASSCCFKGAWHEGTPVGNVEQINGVDVYVSLPAKDYDKAKAVIYLPDIFGIQLNNAKLLSDGFAANGFATYAIDYFAGDPVDETQMSTGNFDRAAWFAKHSVDDARSLMEKVLDGLRERGVKEFGATGYCWGGRYVFDLAHENRIKVAATSHPSRLANPADVHRLLETSKVPMLICSCDTDAQFPVEFQKAADDILGDGKYTPGFKRAHYEKVEHGFATRADLSNPYQKAAKEGAFNETCAWFVKYL